MSLVLDDARPRDDKKWVAGSQPQLPNRNHVIHGKPETGNWKMEIGNWKMEIGWSLSLVEIEKLNSAIGFNFQLLISIFHFPVSIFQFPFSIFRSTSRPLG
jgi:hypothetical protein